MKDFGGLPSIGEISEQQIKEVLEEGFEPRKLEDRNNIQQIIENKSKSVLDSAEETIVTDGTRRGSVDEQLNKIMETQKEKINPSIEKDSSGIGIDEN